MNLAASPHPDDSRRWDRIYLILYLLYIGLGLLARVLGWVHVDAVWFVEAARRVLDGSFDLYRFHASPDIAPPEGLAFSYSPLVAILVAPFVGLADALGWGQSGAERLYPLPLLLIDALAMHQLRRLVHAWRPGVDERFLFLGIGATLGLTGFWEVTAHRGHQEGLVLLALLLTLRLTPRTVLWGGLCAGLALAAKQTSVLMLLPIGVVLGAGTQGSGVRDQGSGIGGRETNTNPHLLTPNRSALRMVLIWAGAALGVFALFMLPAVLRNPGAVWDAFVTQEARRVLLGPGLPVWLDRALQAALDAAAYSSAHTALLAYANAGLVGITTLGMLVAVGWAWRRGRPIGLVDDRLLALVAFGSVAQIVFAKWVSGHYYQLPLALVLLWDIVRAAPRPDRPTTGGLGSFPWIGLGAAIAFRSITPFDTPDASWLKDALLLTLFALLAGATWWGACTTPQTQPAPSTPE